MLIKSNFVPIPKILTSAQHIRWHKTAAKLVVFCQLAKKNPK